MTPQRTRLNSADVARLFDTTKQTVSRWVRTGKIPVHTLPSGRRVFFEDEILPLVPGYEPATTP